MLPPKSENDIKVESYLLLAIFNKKIEPLRREEREGLLFESGTPADKALAGVAIRTKGSWQQN